jgi:hypothetical protein
MTLESSRQLLSAAKISHAIIRSFFGTVYLSVMNSDGAKWNERKHWPEHVVNHHPNSHPQRRSTSHDNRAWLRPAAAVRVSLPSGASSLLTLK